MPDIEMLNIPALEIRQGANRRLYSFAVDGKLLPAFTTISRISRPDGASIEGYQRPEVVSHVREIKRYLESENPLMPNAIVIALDSRTRFQPLSDSGNGHGVTRFGEIIIPIERDCPDQDKPGWIVDGQQRVAAVRMAAVDSFPLCVVAFISETQREQREQFILVNSVKPLPKGLIYELLPGTDSKLPTLLERRRFPNLILERLNFDGDSPLKGMIKTPTQPEGVIKDNSILKMIENSLNDGILYRYRDPNSGEGDILAMLEVLKRFWRAVSQTFVDAWGLPPKRSRLLHGAGVVSLGFLMDAISDRFRHESEILELHFKNDLSVFRHICRWTDGYWDFGGGVQRKWNEIQNVPSDIQLLANYLLFKYKTLVWNT